MKLEVNNIKKSFGGVHAVDDVALSFPEGKISGIIGPNGSGKTTLMNLISGITSIDSGTMAIGEHTHLRAIKSSDIRSYGITRTFQTVCVFEQMTVLDNVLVVLTQRNVLKSIFEKSSNDYIEQAERALKMVNLWEKRNALASTLSYGQRKLLEVARVVSIDAEIYIFDEPFAGLFKEMVMVVSDILKELRSKGKTVILIDHNMHLMRELSDILFVLDAGRVLAEGDPDEVLSMAIIKEAYLGE